MKEENNNSTHDFFRRLVSNPNIDITSIPGYMPPKEVSQELYKGHVEILKAKSPAKPWEE